MKKSFMYYAIIWAIAVAVFNIVVFFIRPIVPGFVIHYYARFWICWGFIIAAFIGNLICAFFALRPQNIKKVFYNIPLITTSLCSLIAMLVAGSALLLIPNVPEWIALIVCAVVFAFNAIAIIKAVWAADSVNAVDERVKTQTAFIKNLVIDAEGLLARAKSEPVKAECKKVYEAVRYSDPMSNDDLSVIEAKITVKMDELSSVIGTDDAEKAKEIADEIVILVGDRNKKCKALK